MPYQTGQRIEGTLQNLELVLGHIAPEANSVLEVGCAEGTFVRNLALHGYFTCGIEANPALAAEANTLKVSNRVDDFVVVNHELTEDSINDLPAADVGLMLSVHHQLVASQGWDQANALLSRIITLPAHQFFFQPAMIADKYGGTSQFADNDYSACEQYFRELFSHMRPHRFFNIGLAANHIPVQEPFRPLYLLDFRDGLDAPRGVDASLTAPNRKENSSLLRVDIQKARDVMWQSFESDGWHYLKRTAEDIVSNSERAAGYEASVLGRYHKAFQPQTYGDVAKRIGLGDIGVVSSFSPAHYLQGRPWDSFTESQAHQIRTGDFATRPVPDWDRHAIGPHTTASGDAEIARLSDLLRDLRDQGYMPQIKPDGYIRGFSLKWGDETRFVVTAGHHRAAVLATLGYRHVLVREQPDMPAVVDRDEVAQWDGVTHGVYTTDQALRYFDSVFQENGGRLAEAFGL